MFSRFVAVLPRVSLFPIALLGYCATAAAVDVAPGGSAEIFNQSATAAVSVYGPPPALTSGTPAPDTSGQGASSGTNNGVQTFKFTLPNSYSDGTLTIRIEWPQAGKDYLTLKTVDPTGGERTSVFVNTNYQLAEYGNPATGEYTVTVRETRTTGTAFTVKATLSRLPSPPNRITPPPPVNLAKDDVVVIAVIDSNINPYHWDYLSAKLPQHQNTDTDDDLPLNQDPSTWIKGYPKPSSFKTFTALNLTLDTAAASSATSTTALHTADIAQWNKLQLSEGTLNKDVNMYWFPGTKIVGHVLFYGPAVGAAEPAPTAVIGRGDGHEDSWAADSHGIGTSSVSAGNLHGSCANCVLVYVHGTDEQANQWIAKQDWIDLQSNSWGLSMTAAARDRLYAGSDTELQRLATERGQLHFFSAGNGLENAFVLPNPTLFSSQEGPDWIVTVGAITASGGSYTGHGRPSDVASIGGSYKSASGGANDSVTAEGNFGGTSNATPVLAGIYGEALYRLRRMLPGASRIQAKGVIAAGPKGCGPANASCALADGKITVHELRDAFLRSARYTPQSLSPGGVTNLPNTVNPDEITFMSEGWGSYFGKSTTNNAAALDVEVNRIVDYVLGNDFTAQETKQRDWFIADSYCRQKIWGSWNFGYDKLGALPGMDPNWPVRSFYTQGGCEHVLAREVDVEQAYANQFSPLNTLGNDTDADGMANGEDNCPADPNTDQADSDADGTGDVCQPPADITPTTFTFPALTGVAKNSSVSSVDTTIAGLGTGVSAAVSVSANGFYIKNGGAPTPTAGTVVNGDTLRLGHMSAATGNTPTTSSITVGDYTTSFTSTTAADPVGPAPIVADLEADKTTGEAPLTVAFDASGTTGGAAGLRYTFVYGNGQQSQAQAAASISYTYGGAGSFDAYVIVTDSTGQVDESSRITITPKLTVTVEPTDVTTAELSVSGGAGMAPLSVNFDASGSRAQSGKTIASYSFDFGDGSDIQTGTSATARHVYTVAGSYSATVTVTDSTGGTATDSETIVVTDNDITVAVLRIVGARSGPAPLTVNFDGSDSVAKTGEDIVSYSFDPDGSGPVGATTGSLATFSYTYTTPGSYEPTLTITDSEGATSQAKAAVTITPAATPAVAAPARKGGALGLLMLPLLLIAARRRSKAN